jgi:cyanate permease
MRNANIGVAVAAVIIFGGGFLLRHAGEGALQLVGLMALISGIAVHNILEERDKRRRRKRTQ